MHETRYQLIIGIANACERVAGALKWLKNEDPVQNVAETVGLVMHFVFCGVLTGQVMQKEMPTNAKALSISSGFQHHRPLVYSSTVPPLSYAHGLISDQEYEHGL